MRKIKGGQNLNSYDIHGNELYNAQKHSEPDQLCVPSTENLRGVSSPYDGVENVKPPCESFRPFIQGGYEVCWFVSGLHSIFMSDKIRQILIENIAKIVINYQDQHKTLKDLVNANNKVKLTSNEAFEERGDTIVTQTGGLLTKLCMMMSSEHKYNEEQKKVIKQVLTLYFAHHMTEEDLKFIKLSGATSCENIKNIIKKFVYGRLLNTKHSKDEYIKFIKNIRGKLSDKLTTEIKKVIDDTTIKVQMWKYVDLDDYSLSKGGKTHRIIYPFLFHVLDFTDCLPIKITSAKEINPKDLIKINEVITIFVQQINNHVKSFIKQDVPELSPKILSITCKIKLVENYKTTIIPDKVGNYNIESAALYVLDKTSKTSSIVENGHAVSGVLCGNEKYIYNSWLDKNTGWGQRYQVNWFETAATWDEDNWPRDNRHTLNYVLEPPPEEVKRYALYEKDLYESWLNYMKSQTGGKIKRKAPKHKK